MKKTILVLCLSIAIIGVVCRKKKFIMDESYVCSVKQSCLDCLKLPHCSWCSTEMKCFSKQPYAMKNFCLNNTIDHHDYGLSFEENAACSCNYEAMEQHCYPPGVITGPQCSDRGVCICGQCQCNKMPDPTKMVMGQFCEFDNFSCEGSRCNEGPYYISGASYIRSEDDVPVS